MEDSDLRRAYGEKAASRAADFGVEDAKSQYWEIVRTEVQHLSRNGGID
jgi:hypothetical protein